LIENIITLILLNNKVYKLRNSRREFKERIQGENSRREFKERIQGENSRREFKERNKQENLGCDFCSTFSKSGIEIKIEW